MRYPAISPDGASIAFTWHGDIYKVSSSGGVAKPLFVHKAYDFMPVWSHDGKHIAFASDQFGSFDIFIVPSTGGEPTRLSFYSGDEYPYDFCDQDQAVLFGAVRMDAPENRQFPSDALQELYKVPADGGRTRQVLTTTAEDARISKDGRYIIYHDRKGRENPWRKHQVSSVARDIWIYDTAAASHKRLSSFGGEDRNPVFSENNKIIYYLSEKSGNFNVYQLALGGSLRSKQLTFFKNDPVRFLSIAQNNTLCFGYKGQIFLKEENHQPVKVDISIMAGQNNNKEEMVPLTEVQEMSISPSGNELAFISRGEVFIAGTTGNLVKRITDTPGEETGVGFSPDGRRLIYASERNNSWKIYQSEIINKNEESFVAASAIIETPVITNDRENYQPEYSPDGNEIAFIEDRTSLRIYNFASGNIRTILNHDQLISRQDNDQYFRWSPDGKWLLIQFTEPGIGNDEIGLISASGNGKLLNLTRSGFSDVHPQWMMDGKLITWYSDRLGLHSYANSSTRQTDVYGMFADEKIWRDFKLPPSEVNLPAADTIGKISGQTDEKNLSDPAHLTKHTERLTTNSSFLADALVSRDGRSLYHLSRTDKNYDLWLTSLQTRETKILLPLNVKDAGMRWDKEQKNIFLLADGRIIKIDPLKAKQDSINTRTEIHIDAAEERKSMFGHVWRRTWQTFYSSGMHGAEWDSLKTDYQHYLTGINNNHDFAEMLNELLGELNVSHTGAAFKDRRKDMDVTASLGIFYDQEYNGDGVRIKEVIESGPLDDHILLIKPGAILEAIDGVVIDKNKDISQYLNGKAGKKILLRINDGSHSNEIMIKPISPSEEEDLLYKRWVKRNQEETGRMSNGELGYVHLYRMNDAAYRSAYEDIMGKFAGCKAIVVDTRFNRGGDLAPELAMFLSGIKVRENASDRFRLNNEPSFRWTRPSIVLVNEANYSDGHCFAYDYQYLHMGKLVGMPVPGSCTWMTGQALQDNSLSYSVPTLGVKTVNGRYLENYQTEPDIRVMNEYGTVSKGRDQQLEAAIIQLKKDIRKTTQTDVSK